MSRYSIVEAVGFLSSLIDRALAGEEVVITRHGRPVVELMPISAPLHAITDADLERLDAHRVGTTMPRTDAGQSVSEVRDEDW